MVWIIAAFALGFLAGRWWAGRQFGQSLSSTRAIASEQAQVLAAAQRMNQQAFIAQSVMRAADRYQGGGRRG